MALKIRLARGGAKKRPFYQIVVADARSPRDGRFVEKVGTYNPMVPQEHQDRIRLNTDRIKHWLSVGAQPTDRVALFLGKANIIEMPVTRVTPLKSTPKAKAQERVKAAEEALAAKAKAAAEPKPEPVPEPEPAPEPEAPAEAEADTETVPEVPGEAPAKEVSEAETETVPEIPGEEPAKEASGTDADTETVPDVKP